MPLRAKGERKRQTCEGKGKWEEGGNGSKSKTALGAKANSSAGQLQFTNKNDMITISNENPRQKALMSFLG